MPELNRTASVILSVGLVLGLSALGYLLADAALAVKSRERTVEVKGLSEREVPADVVVWPVTFQVAANDLDEVFAKIEQNSEVIRTFLAGYGIASDELSLSPPFVTDLYAQEWGDKQHIKFRYTGAASLTVYSENVPKVREAMANVIELGKQGVPVGGHVPYIGPAENRFLFTQLSALKPEMVEEATKNARSVAEKFAQDSGSRLGKIRRARQGQFSIEDRDPTTPHIKKVRVVSTVEYYLSD